MLVAEKPSGWSHAAGRRHLRHQLAVLQRRQPRRPNLDWADRALFATLLAVIPKARRQVLRLLVTPDTWRVSCSMTISA